jgi:hypothetical protein
MEATWAASAGFFWIGWAAALAAGKFCNSRGIDYGTSGGAGDCEHFLWYVYHSKLTASVATPGRCRPEMLPIALSFFMGFLRKFAG